MKDITITTPDNPWNPFTNFDDWYEFDISNGYHTLELIARFCYLSEELSDADFMAEKIRGINEIKELLPFYIIVKDE